MSWQPSQGSPKTRAEWLEKQEYDRAHARHPVPTSDPQQVVPQASIARTGPQPRRRWSAGTVIGIVLAVAVVGATVLAIAAFAVYRLISNGDGGSPPSSPEQPSVSGQTTTDLNVRESGSRDTPVVATLPAQASVTIECVTDQGWMRLEQPYPGNYAYGDFIQTDASPPACD